jgi:hypothetical protein
VTAKKTKQSPKAAPQRMTPDQRYRWVVFGGYFLILLILFFQIFFKGMTLAEPDAVSASYTAQGLNYHFFKQGFYPLWNPYIFSGMPALAAMSFHMFIYLPSVVYLPLQWLGIPGLFFQIFHYLLAGLGTYLLLRRWQLSRIASFFGGVVFMMTPYLITMLAFGHGSQIMSAVYFPLIFYAVDRLIEKPNPWNAALLALFVGLQLQRGHIQIAYFNWMMIGLFYVFKIIADWKNSEFRRKLLPMTLYFGAALLLGFGMAAVMYLPVHSYTSFSIRGGTGGGTGFDYATMWSFSPKEMATFLIPSFYGFGGITYWGTMPFTDYPNYMGIIVLLLAVFSLALKFRKTTLFFVILFIISLLAAFGKHFFLYGLLYNVLPYFNKFRVPAMLLIITQFATAILAGFALHDLIALFRSEQSQERQQRIRTVIYVFGGVLILLALYLLFFQGGFKNFMFGKFRVNPRLPMDKVLNLKTIQFGMLYRDFWLMLLMLGAALVCIYLTLIKTIKPQILAFILLGLTIVDLYVVDARIIKPRPATTMEIELKDDPAAQFMKEDEDIYRIFPLNELFSDKHWTAFRIQSIGGYHAAKVKIYQEFMDQVSFGNLGVLRMLNVKYLVSTKRFSSPDFIEAKLTSTISQTQQIPVAIYQLSDYLPRAFFTDSVQVFSDKVEMFTQLKDPNYDPEQVVYLEKAPNLVVTAPDTQLVDLTHWDIHNLSIDVYTDRPAQLVISEIYYPNGWKAFIDGKPTEIYQTNYILRSVSVPAGKHNITIEFRPSDVRIGLVLSILSIVVVGGILIVYRKKR